MDSPANCHPSLCDHQWRACRFLVTVQDNFTSAIVYACAVCMSSVCIVPTAITGDFKRDKLVERHGKAAFFGHFLLLQQLVLRNHCQHESLGMFFHKPNSNSKKKKAFCRVFTPALQSVILTEQHVIRLFQAHCE